MGLLTTIAIGVCDRRGLKRNDCGDTTREGQGEKGEGDQPVHQILEGFPKKNNTLTKRKILATSKIR